jgi:predicted dienelactone hydrolase
VPRLLLIVFCVLAAAASWHGACAQAPDQVFKVGVTTRAFKPAEPYDWRGAQTRVLLTTVWYPAAAGAVEQPQRIGPPGRPPIFDGGMSAPDAAVASAPPERFALLVLSHGTGGSAQSLAWLATALAARGYVVAAVNHPGNNALEPYTVEGFVLWWKRAQDLSVLIDAMLADTQFGPRLDPARIGAIGFSLGGYTVIEIAGAITSRAQIALFCEFAPVATQCAGPPEFPDVGAKAVELEKSDPAFAAALAQASNSYRDPRVRAVFAIAPALGPAFTAESLMEITTPVAVAAGQADAIVPVGSGARYIAGNIPRAQLTLFRGGAGHYTFLDLCTDAGRETLPQLCVDAPGVDRAAVHDAVIALATGFFAANLK